MKAITIVKAGVHMKAVAGYYVFLCKYLVYVSSNQESLCSSHISMFWVVLEIFW